MTSEAASELARWYVSSPSRSFSVATAGLWNSIIGGPFDSITESEEWCRDHTDLCLGAFIWQVGCGRKSFVSYPRIVFPVHIRKS